MYYIIYYISYALQIPCFMRLSNEGLYNVVDSIMLDKSFKFLSHEVGTFSGVIIYVNELR